jgi:hypothetical protein
LPLVEDRPDLFEARHAKPVRLVDQLPVQKETSAVSAEDFDLALGKHDPG